VLTTTGLVLGIIALAVLWFVVLWLAICYGIARAARWPHLLRLYKTGPFEGPTIKFAGYVGVARYRGGALLGGATPAGLSLNVVAPFRIGAGPVFIPWQDIAVEQPSPGLRPLVTFHFQKAGTSLRVQESVASKLLGWQRGAP
jgi:hypothetical protein